MFSGILFTSLSRILSIPVGKEICNRLKKCNQYNAGKKPIIDVIDFPNGYDGNNNCTKRIAKESEKGTLIGGFFVPVWSESDNFLWIKYNEEKLFIDYSLELCFNEDRNVIQFGIKDKLYIKTIVAVCDNLLEEAGFILINNLQDLRTKIPQEISVLGNLFSDLDKFRIYGEGSGKYFITEMA